jgi:hypothetical protein
MPDALRALQESRIASWAIAQLGEASAMEA